MYRLTQIRTIPHVNAWRRLNHSFAHDMPQWPAATNPTPYEIFGTTQEAFDKSALKATFTKMAKMYHPDSRITMRGLTAEVRADRFKKIVSAYGILKDDRKRRDWDSMHAFRHGYRPSSSSSDQKQYGPVGYAAYARAANFNFDDMYAHDAFSQEEREAQRRRTDAAFQEKLRQNRNQMTGIVAVAVLIVAAIQISTITKWSEKQLELDRESSYRTKLDELNAHANYGRGNMQDERIARFLATRQSGSYYNKYVEHPPASVLPGSGSVHPPRDEQLALPAPGNR